MEHSTVRKLIRAAALSLLVLTTLSGVAGLGVIAANSASSQPDVLGGVPVPGSDQPDPTSTPAPTPVPPLPVP